jgi:hypothetical protein
MFLNTQTMHIKIIHNSIARISLKTIIPDGIRTRFFCSLGGCDKPLIIFFTEGREAITCQTFVPDSTSAENPLCDASNGAQIIGFLVSTHPSIRNRVGAWPIQNFMQKSWPLKCCDRLTLIKGFLRSSCAKIESKFVKPNQSKKEYFNFFILLRANHLNFSGTLGVIQIEKLHN